MTFSVVGRCAETGRFGVACTTSSICVGARCPWVRTGVGAVTTQFLTDPALGVAVLNELEAGKSSDQALQAVLTSAPNKLHAQYRQVACIDAAGRTACCTGEHVVGHAGTASGVDVIATGNLLTDAAVPAAMVSAFERTIGEHLAVRLLAALEAGEAAGGESDVCHSAVLLVAHDDPSAGWPLVNLRVDWSDSSPLAELRELWQRYEPQLDDYATRATNPVSLLQLQPQSVPPKKAEVNFYRGHSFLLYFDKATEAALASAGARLHGMRHLGVAGQRYGYRPHISLSICGGCDIKSATTLLQRMAQRTAPFELTLGALGTGGGGQGLFRRHAFADAPSNSHQRVALAPCRISPVADRESQYSDDLSIRSVFSWGVAPTRHHVAGNSRRASWRCNPAYLVGTASSTDGVQGGNDRCDYLQTWV